MSRKNYTAPKPENRMTRKERKRIKAARRAKRHAERSAAVRRAAGDPDQFAADFAVGYTKVVRNGRLTSAPVFNFIGK